MSKNSFKVLNTDQFDGVSNIKSTQKSSHKLTKDDKFLNFINKFLKDNVVDCNQPIVFSVTKDEVILHYLDFNPWRFLVGSNCNDGIIFSFVFLNIGKYTIFDALKKLQNAFPKRIIVCCSKTPQNITQSNFATQYDIFNHFNKKNESLLVCGKFSDLGNIISETIECVSVIIFENEVMKTHLPDLGYADNARKNLAKNLIIRVKYAQNIEPSSVVVTKEDIDKFYKEFSETRIIDLTFDENIDDTMRQQVEDVFVVTPL